MYKIYLIALILGLLIALVPVYAMEYQVGQNIEISLTNATDGTIQTGKTCLLTISNATAILTEIPMTDNSDGTYYWSINSSIHVNLTHPYTAKANCTVNSNFWTTWAYFYLVDDIIANKTDYTAKNPIDYKADISSLPTYCGSGSSNLTYGDVGSGSSNLTVTNLDDESASESELDTSHGAGSWETATQVNITQLALTNIIEGVWTRTTRTLSSFGTLIADIWASTTRTLTSFAFKIGLNTTAINDIDTRINQTHGIGYYNTTGVNQTISSYYNSTMNIIIPE